MMCCCDMTCSSRWQQVEDDGVPHAGQLLTASTRGQILKKIAKECTVQRVCSCARQNEVKSFQHQVAKNAA